MAATNSTVLSPQNMPILSAEYLEPRWYATYTCASREKRVAEQLDQRSIERFLPLYESVRQWKDRRVRLQLPLFRGYVFVRIALRDRLQVLQLPGVVRMVGFNGFPTPLDDVEIESLRQALAQGVRAEPHSNLTVGRRVLVVAGPLAGREGILTRRRGSMRVVLSLDLIQKSVVVEVDMVDIAPAEVCKVRPAAPWIEGRKRLSGRCVHSF